MPVVVYPEPVSVQHLREVAAAAAKCASVTWTEGFAITFLQLASISLFVGALILFIKALSASTSLEHRKFYLPIVLSCFIGGCIYFAMFSDQGWVISHNCRQSYIVRYIDWCISIPLVILSLGLLCEATVEDIAAAMGYTVLMCVSLFCGTVTYVDFPRWIWFFFSLFFLFLAAHQILYCFVPYMADGSSPVSRLSSLVVISLCLYPFLWMLSEGFHIFSIPLETVCFGIVDVVVRAVFGVLLMMSSSQAHYSTGSAFSDQATH